jgi:hypothetical protein
VPFDEGLSESEESPQNSEFGVGLFAYRNELLAIPMSFWGVLLMLLVAALVPFG